MSTDDRAPESIPRDPGARATGNVVSGDEFGFEDFARPGPGIAPPSDPMIVTRADAIVAGPLVTAVILRLAAPVELGRAEDLAQYRLQLPGPGEPADRAIPLRSAAYDPEARAVTLHLEGPVSTRLLFEVVVGPRVFPIGGVAQASDRPF